MPSYELTFKAEIRNIKDGDDARAAAEAVVNAFPFLVLRNVKIENPTVENVSIVSNAD